MYCNLCEESPCIATVHGEEAIVSGGEEANIHGERTNSARRRYAYCVFVRLWVGYTGRGNRVKLPDCVLKTIRDAFPSEEYMGHRDE